MERIKIKIIEQLNNVVARAEEIVTCNSYQSVDIFDVMKEETEKLLAITDELKRTAFPENNISNNLINLKNILQQLQQKVVATPIVEEGMAVDAEPQATVEVPAVLASADVMPAIEPVAASESIMPILDFTVEETPIKETVPVVAETEPIAATPLAEVEQPVAETSHLLDRLRSLSEEGKAENTSTLRTMIDKLRTSSSPSMPEIHFDNPVDLRTSIGINEKFLFVNELFGGSIRECNEALSFLNNLDDLDSAMSQMHIYAEKFGWDEESVAYMTLAEAVNQRFSQLVLM